MRHVSQEQRRQMIATAAYLRAERRGFSNGDAVSDWLEAEAEVETELAKHDLLADLDERLATANEKLQGLRKRFSRLRVEAREELTDELAKLVKLRDRLQMKIEAVRAESELAGEKALQRAEKAKQQAERAWQQISRSLERLTSKRKRGD
jgi:hypothetical protein